jgi:hypothetical protein
MPRRSPLRSAQVGSLSICGKLLKKGQSITVPESAVGPRERRKEAQGKITIRRSNKSGFLQITRTLGNS